MRSNETRANEEIDNAGTLSAGRQVRIVSGPLVLTAPRNTEGQRRFVIVAGTVVLEGGNAVPAHAELHPHRVSSPLAHRREGIAEFALHR